MQLSDSTTTITLPNALEWVNEFDWSSIEQATDRTNGGALVVHERTLTKGRPIELVGGEQVWVNRSVIESLYAFLNTADKQMTLTMPDNSTHTVIFDRSQQPLVARPVWRKNIQENTDKYTLTLRFLVI